MVLEVDLEEAVATQEVVATEEVDTVLLLMVLLTLHQEASEAVMGMATATREVATATLVLTRILLHVAAVAIHIMAEVTATVESLMATEIEDTTTGAPLLTKETSHIETVRTDT